MLHFNKFKGVIDDLEITKRELYDYLLDILTYNHKNVSNIHNLKTDALCDILVYSVRISYIINVKIKDLKRHIKFVNASNGSIKLRLLNPKNHSYLIKQTINDLNKCLENQIATGNNQPRIYLNSRILSRDEWFCYGIYIDNYFIAHNIELILNAIKPIPDSNLLTSNPMFIKDLEIMMKHNWFRSSEIKPIIAKTFIDKNTPSVKQLIINNTRFDDINNKIANGFYFNK